MVPVYVAEETHNASKEVPKSIIYTFSVTAISGVAVCLIAAFCITDIEAAAADATYVDKSYQLRPALSEILIKIRGYPLFNLVLDHWGQAATSAFFLVVTPVGFFGGSGTLLTYASQIAAFARDGGFPWHEHVAYVHPRLNLPVYSLAILATGTFLILIIALSPEASSVIYSLSVVTGLITFVVPVIFRIFAGDRWVPGPWNLGRWSIPIHVITVVTQIYFIIVECFPPERAWTWATFNYNFALTFGATLISVALYLGGGRKTYKGLDMAALESWRRHAAQRTE